VLFGGSAVGGRGVGRGAGVVVPQHTGDLFISHDINTLIGVCIVSDDITETDDPVDVELVDPL